MLGYFALKPPSRVATTNTLSTTYIENEDYIMTEESPIYQVMEDIILNDFDGFIQGRTSEEDVKSLVGERHDSFGSGFIGDVYYTADGYKVLVYYNDGIVERICYVNDDGSITTL